MSVIPNWAFSKTKTLAKKSSTNQIERALNAVKGEMGSSIWAGHYKAERFHFRLVQARKDDRRRGRR